MRRGIWNAFAALLLLLPALAGAQSQPEWTYNPSGAGLWTAPPTPFAFRAPVTFDSTARFTGGAIGPFLLTDGNAAAPALGFSAETNTGLYRLTTSVIDVTLGGTVRGRWTPTSWQFNTPLQPMADNAYDLSSAASRWKDLYLSSSAKVTDGFGGAQSIAVSTELLTLSTSGATTDSVANLLPANSIIDSVVVRVTTGITTAATFNVGDATTAARFSTGVAAAAGTTAVGLSHMAGGVSTDATGPVQTAAAKVRITCNTTPGAGVVRITVFYRTFTPPSS